MRRRNPYLPPDLRPFKIKRYVKGLGEYDTDDIPRDIEPEYNPEETLPIDLWPRPITEGRMRAGGEVSPAKGIDLSNELLARITDNTGVLASLAVLDRGLIGTSITVGTTPTMIIQSRFLRGYIIMNPSLVVGGTATGTVLASAARSSNGNTQASSLGVANYRDMHLFLNVTAVSGASPTLDIYAQALDPVTLRWADTQIAFTGINATGTYYANIGSLGLATDFAIRWVIGGAGPSFTFSVSFALKEGLPGTGAGVGKTIYLGNSGVTTTSGFPLLEGQSRSFYLRENTELWAVASTSLDLRIFEL